MADDAKDLSMFTIYFNPDDYPVQYVVRRYAITPTGTETDEKPTIVTNTLLDARSAIPQGLCNIGRSPADAMSVVETWM